MVAIVERTPDRKAGTATECRRERSDRLLARVPSAWVRSSMAIVLAGGRGTRLAQLTDWRTKPAVSFGGSYRIIDFALSNCVNSGLRRIGVCTQYKAQSLIGHLQRAWSFLDGRFGEFVELLPAQQRLEPVWYRGTADAVYQNFDLLLRHGPQYVVVLAGDHVYKMDYQVLLAEHVECGADATIACIEMPLAEASSFGVVDVDGEGWIRRFEEKPAWPRPMPGRPGVALISMGIYVFNAETLYAALSRDAAASHSEHDFGRDVIPALNARGCRLRAHNFRASCVNMARGMPYWRDVGTVDAFWQANLELTRVVPDLNLYDREWPIWTWQEQLPPAKFVFDDEDRRGIAPDSLVASGCIVSGTTVRRSLLSTNVRVYDAASIADSVLLPNVQVGEGAVLRRVVVDKYCRIPPGLVVGVDPKSDRSRFHVTGNGVTLITPEMLGQALHLHPWVMLHGGVGRGERVSFVAEAEMTRDTAKDLDPATSLRKADRAADRVVARPDGYYWVADDGEQEFGPYATAAAAMLAHAESIEGAVEEARALEEVEAELGVAERQDRDLIEAEEQPFVAGEAR